MLASTLLGADQPRLKVGELVVVASLFGISAGAARTCLWRMAANGELVSQEGTYALAGHLLERRQGIDDVSQMNAVTPRRWGNTWELAVVSLHRRSAADRLELRNAAAALHLVELREGVWIRPDNLDKGRLPQSRAVLERQCVHFHGAESDVPVQTVQSLFALDAWAADARRLTAAMNDELDTGPAESDDTVASWTYRFALLIAVLRHLRLDPLLPVELVGAQWPGPALRYSQSRFEDAIKRRINNEFQRTGQ